MPPTAETADDPLPNWGDTRCREPGIHLLWTARAPTALRRCPSRTARFEGIFGRAYSAFASMIKVE